MYQTLIVFHSIVRWFVLISLVYSIYRAYRGYTKNLSFSKSDNSIRHWTATIAHMQLIIGITLYTQSPVITYFWHNFNEALHNPDVVFFGLYHFLLMLAAIVIITIGSALTKRKATDQEKFKTMLVWYFIALVIICLAIPWPFSPFTSRPYFR